MESNYATTLDATQSRDDRDKRGFPESTTDDHLLFKSEARERRQNGGKH